MKQSKSSARSWTAKWIGRPACHGSSASPVLPAPFIRKEFNYDGAAGKATVFICGLGYFELHINGRKVGDGVLTPGVSQYDKRDYYMVFDVSSYLVKGPNAIGVILGNGWYNCHSTGTWHFNKAAWRDYPKMILELEAGGQPILRSDETWKLSSGPITFDGLRNGEFYDARLELDGWDMPAYDDSKWVACLKVNAAGGILSEDTMPPCKVMRTIAPPSKWAAPDGGTVFDLGESISGWAKISVSGEAGAKLVLTYGELLKEDKSVDQAHIGKHVKAEPGYFQTDNYILKGSGVETWEPRFSYHGYRYVQVNITGKAELKSLEGRFVYTSFEQIGAFSCSNEDINKLHECTVRSYEGNFVAIPTDCPHREKNGWTGDAQLAAELGLYNFDASSAYNQWMQCFADVQRPSGQLPGIVPSCGWGFNWGSGPAWDCAFMLIPEYVRIYSGDTSAIKTHYEAMRRYVDYCTAMATDNIVSFGLGDWCHLEWSRIVEVPLTSTAYYYILARLLAKFAKIAGHPKDVKTYDELADNIRIAFNKRFYKGDGIYAKGEQTALSCALYQGLVEDSEKSKVAAKLVEAVRANNYKVDFGILGSKYVPRALADNGYVEDAYRLIAQPEFPGWISWLKRGATTLWEDWKGDNSLNHIMFGDVDAWLYKYIAGIAPDETKPAFKHIVIKPNPVKGLEWAKATHKIPAGVISSSWTAKNGIFELEVQIPEGSVATVSLPDGKTRKVKAGKHSFKAALA